MSHDPDEQLPESLQNLQLVPFDREKQSNCSSSQIACSGNPFLVDVPSKAANDEQKIQINLFGPTCCHCERNASNSSHPIKLKSPESLRKFMESRSISFIIPHSFPMARFRKVCSISTCETDRRRSFLGRRSAFIREPMLKRIGRSMHHYSTTDDESSCDAETNVLGMSRQSLSIRARRKKSNSVSIYPRLSIDVSSLVDECVNLSLRESDLVDRAHCTHKLETQPSTSMKVNGSDQLNRSICATTTVNCVAASSSSSCSQQARIPSASCDVTMDELASYFETFVHIPKKMSTMAEMMYI